jgi:hypothetical protein
MVGGSRDGIGDRAWMNERATLALQQEGALRIAQAAQSSRLGVASVVGGMTRGQSGEGDRCHKPHTRSSILHLRSRNDFGALESCFEGPSL